MKNWLKFQLIRYALSFESPVRFSLSNPSEVRQQNYVYSFLHTELADFGAELVLREENAEVLTLGVPTIGEDRQEQARSILYVYSNVDRIHFNFKGSEYIFDGYFRFFVFHVLQFHRLIRLQTAAFRYAYSFHRPSIKSRRDVLSALVEHYNSRYDGANSIMHDTDARRVDQLDLCERVYGSKIGQHPRFNSLMRHLLLVLESLVEDGALERVPQSSGYLITGRAHSLLHDIEREDQRHADNIRHTRWITILTALLALTAILQIPIVLRLLQLD